MGHRRFANQYPVLSDLATVPLNILSGIYGSQHNIQNAIYGHETGKLEAYGLDAGNLVREHRQEDWTGEGQFAYGTAMSILDSTAAAFMSKAIPGLGGAALGGSAYNSKLREALDRGLSYDKAQKTAIAAGVLEMLFEELSIEKLFKVGEAGSIGELAGNILKQAGFEASEEMFL